jgi:hypothetical protein
MKEQTLVFEEVLNGDYDTDEAEELNEDEHMDENNMHERTNDGGIHGDDTEQ